MEKFAKINMIDAKSLVIWPNAGTCRLRAGRPGTAPAEFGNLDFDATTHAYLVKDTLHVRKMAANDAAAMRASGAQSSTIALNSLIKNITVHAPLEIFSGNALSSHNLSVVCDKNAVITLHCRINIQSAIFRFSERGHSRAGGSADWQWHIFRYLKASVINSASLTNVSFGSDAVFSLTIVSPSACVRFVAPNSTRTSSILNHSYEILDFICIDEMGVRKRVPCAVCRGRAMGGRYQHSEADGSKKLCEYMTPASAAAAADAARRAGPPVQQSQQQAQRPQQPQQPTVVGGRDSLLQQQSEAEMMMAAIRESLESFRATVIERTAQIQPMQSHVRVPASVAAAGGDSVSKSGAFAVAARRGDGVAGSQCRICLEERANVVIVPCGHACLCHGCALSASQRRTMNACPMCRAPIREVIPLFVAAADDEDENEEVKEENEVVIVEESETTTTTTASS